MANNRNSHNHYVFRDRVCHNYHDCSNEPDPEPASLGENNGLSGACNVEAHFPVKLHYMLSQVESDGTSHIVSWQPHGRCFVVHKMKEFVSAMLPLWFRQTKFASFQRQLNLYGFRRITQGRDKGGYYHEYFLRGRPMLAQKITRTKVKGQGARKASSPDTEPRLYEYPWMKEEEEAGLAVNSSNDNSVASLSGIISDPMNDTTTTIVANNSPAMSLGDALSYFNFGDLRSIHDNWDTAAQNHQYTSSTQDLNHQATLRSLLGSSGTRTFVPIAPAPPANKSLEDNPGAVNMQQLISQDSYHSVLNALRATAQQQQQQQQQQLPSLGFGGDNSNGSNGNNVPPANWLTQPGPTFF